MNHSQNFQHHFVDHQHQHVGLPPGVRRPGGDQQGGEVGVRSRGQLSGCPPVLLPPASLHPETGGPAPGLLCSACSQAVARVDPRSSRSDHREGVHHPASDLARTGEAAQ